jgi:hypothetical protein
VRRKRLSIIRAWAGVGTSSRRESSKGEWKGGNGNGNHGRIAAMKRKRGWKVDE